MTVSFKLGDKEARGTNYNALDYEIKQVEGEDLTFDFVVSDESRDRQGDRILVRGWDLKNFKANPTILFGHDILMPPIGRALAVKKDIAAKQLKATIQFTDESVNPFGATIGRLFKEGFMRATSVGFVPMKMRRAETEAEEDELDLGRFGVLFEKQELLEISAVPVPANPNALVEAVQRGCITSRAAQWVDNIYAPIWKEFVDSEEYGRNPQTGVTSGNNKEVHIKINALDSQAFLDYAKENEKEVKRAIEQALKDNPRDSFEDLILDHLESHTKKLDALAADIEELRRGGHGPTGEPDETRDSHTANDPYGPLLEKCDSLDQIVRGVKHARKKTA
jgi:HK97 family phage prohead protease